MKMRAISQDEFARGEYTDFYACLTVHKVNNWNIFSAKNACKLSTLWLGSGHHSD
jgi:hypothetical protein